MYWPYDLHLAKMSVEKQMAILKREHDEMLEHNYQRCANVSKGPKVRMANSQMLFGRMWHTPYETTQDYVIGHWFEDIWNGQSLPPFVVSCQWRRAWMGCKRPEMCQGSGVAKEASTQDTLIDGDDQLTTGWLTTAQETMRLRDTTARKKRRAQHLFADKSCKCGRLHPVGYHH